MKETEAIWCSSERAKLGNDGEFRTKGGRALASGYRYRAGWRERPVGRKEKSKEWVVGPHLGFMEREMNRATTTDVMCWRDRENVVKVEERDRVV